MPHKLTRLHILLFIATFLTTLYAGAWQSGVIPWEEPERIYLGLPFSLTLLLILLTHELSHYYMSRKHNIPASLPYFIPAPPPIPPLIGTFGAIIKMKPPIYDRRALIDIGASGPIGGFLVAVIAIIIGLGYSTVIPLDVIHRQPGLEFGESLLFGFLAKITLNIDPDKHTILLHPIAFAGWVGLLVTSLNLLPIGQLDGGHISYALFGKKHSLIAKGMIPLLIIFGIKYWPGWIVWAVIMIIMGYEHPPVVYPDIQLDRKRILVGWISLIIFILTFMPVPIKVIN